MKEYRRNGLVREQLTVLYQGLSHLQAGEFIYEQPAFPEPEYTFKHALTQEVAYQSLLGERRGALQQGPGLLEEVSEEELLEHLGSRVATWWLPDVIEFAAEVPKTGTGKFDKKVLRAKYAGLLLED